MFYWFQDVFRIVEQEDEEIDPVPIERIIVRTRVNDPGMATAKISRVLNEGGVLVGSMMLVNDGKEFCLGELKGPYSSKDEAESAD